MRRRAALVLLVLSGCTAACGDGDGPGSGAEVATTYALPFGLEQVPGTEPVGRPVVREEALLVYSGTPITGIALSAAYRVTDGDPVEALRAWLVQLTDLRLIEHVRAGQRSDGRPTESWAEVGGHSSHDGQLATAQVQLWNTTEGDILLVDVSRSEGAATGVATEVLDELTSSDDRPDPLDVSLAGASDELFTEQGDTIHLPAGAEALMPTLPTRGGTGGSTSVIAAADPRAALQAMLDEAIEANDYYEVDEIVETEYEGMQILTGRFVIPAGGWGFTATSIKAPDDERATIVIRSFAD